MSARIIAVTSYVVVSDKGSKVAVVPAVLRYLIIAKYMAKVYVGI